MEILLYWNMQTWIEFWLDLSKKSLNHLFWICRLVFIFEYADFLQLFFRLAFLFLQTCCCILWICRLFADFFEDLLFLFLQTCCWICRLFADLFFFYDFWIGFFNLSVAKLWVSIELFSENLWKHILVFWKVFKW